jgi:hypothetical protein
MRRRPTRRGRPGARGARLVGLATVVRVIPGTAAPCPDTAGRRRQAAADDPERAPPRNRPRRNRRRAWRQRTEQHTGHGNTYLAVILGNAAAAKQPLPRRTAPLRRRRGGSELAIVATGRFILVIAWHVLSSPDATSATSAQGSTPPASTRTPQAQPHLPGRSPRLHRHPPARCLTPPPTRPGLRRPPPEAAAATQLTDFRISGWSVE